MKDLFVPYELAVKLKEKGFNNECMAYYETTPDYKFIFRGLPGYNRLIGELPNLLDLTVCAPLWQQVIDWLREEKKLHLVISETKTGSWHIYVKNIGQSEAYAYKTYSVGPNYYSALKTAIEKVLESI